MGALLGGSLLSGTSAGQSIGGTFGFGQNNGSSVFGGVPQSGVVSNGDAYNLNNQAAGNIGSQAAFVNALNQQNGIANQSSTFNQLQGVANGTGPNPAQAQLAQATGANVANQAALMAGQRGASQNVGLIARQAAQQGAATQQQAAGQAATLQANQSLGALGQLGGIAGQQVNQQQGALNNQYGAIAGQQGLVNSQNQNAINQNQGINNTNSSLALQNSKNQAGLISGLASGAGAAMGATGGEVNKNTIGSNPSLMADGGQVSAMQAPTNESNVANNSTGPQSFVGKYFSGLSTAPAPVQMPTDSGTSKGGSGLASIMGKVAMAEGGKVPALLSPGERYLSPKDAQAVASGKADPMKKGEKIPGKASVSGDSLENDTVKKTLKTGGVVIPRSVVNSKSSKKEAAFVAANLKKLRK